MTFLFVEVRPFRASSHRRYLIYDSEAQLTDLIKNCQKADIYITISRKCQCFFVKGYIDSHVPLPLLEPYTRSQTDMGK